jgi:hypothetical protein
VLCLAELDDNDIGRGVADAVAYGQLWAFSLGGKGKAEGAALGVLNMWEGGQARRPLL